MASNLKRTAAALNLEADQICALLNGGFLDLYTGAQPAVAGDAITTQVKVARLIFSSPAFQFARAGVATAYALTPETNAPSSGLATWFRALAQNGTVIFDGSVGLVDADCVLTDVNISAHGEVHIDAMSYTARASA